MYVTKVNAAGAGAKLSTLIPKLQNAVAEPGGVFEPISVAEATIS